MMLDKPKPIRVLALMMATIDAPVIDPKKIKELLRHTANDNADQPRTGGAA